MTGKDSSDRPTARPTDPTAVRNRFDAKQDLEKLASAMIFDEDIRKLLATGDPANIKAALTTIGAKPENLDKAIEILENFPYEDLQLLASSFGSKLHIEVN